MVFSIKIIIWIYFAVMPGVHTFTNGRLNLFLFFGKKIEMCQKNYTKFTIHLNRLFTIEWRY
jgi:hypothetical protein